MYLVLFLKNVFDISHIFKKFIKKVLEISKIFFKIIIKNALREQKYIL